LQKKCPRVVKGVSNIEKRDKRGKIDKARRGIFEIFVEIYNMEK